MNRSSLIAFYDQIRKRMVLVTVLLSAFFLSVTSLIQYREKKAIVTTQALYVSKSVRNDLLSGNKAYVYETCRALFSDSSLSQIQIVKGDQLYCDFQREGYSLFGVGVEVPIKFNTDIDAEADNTAAVVAVKLDAKGLILSLFASVVCLGGILVAFYIMFRRLHSAIELDVVRPLEGFSSLMSLKARDTIAIEKIRAESKFDELHSLTGSYISLMEQLAVVETRLKAESRRAALVEVSRRIAHDIRSPLMALGIIADRIQNQLPEEGRLLGQASNQIIKVAESVLDASRENLPASAVASSAITNEPTEVSTRPGGTFAITSMPNLGTKIAISLNVH